ncbi:hypothetical protein [uncultured Methanoregula sp.]|uniref:hypothetical protein n=1 Tax=uncultured Methanoregula sp. TaxID=1005933 RepID=UPI002AAB090C|nr:hypothetical protein [uncultured Methanoregula sp.]
MSLYRNLNDFAGVFLWKGDGKRTGDLRGWNLDDTSFFSDGDWCGLLMPPLQNLSQRESIFDLSSGARRIDGIPDRHQVIRTGYQFFPVSDGWPDKKAIEHTE